ncbi:MAG: 30S ribosomal protein S16 [Candidatus Eisenbacteria bacterium]
MAVRIRLQRKGAKHMAFYRIVAADSRSPRDGRFIEQLGYYDPLRDPPEIKVDTPKIIDWLSKGASPSDTVESLLRRVGVMQMWHEVKGGKVLEELGHIEDEARKRLEAKASMERRKKEETKATKVEAMPDEAKKPEAKPDEAKKPEAKPDEAKKPEPKPDEARKPEATAPVEAAAPTDEVPPEAGPAPAEEAQEDTVSKPEASTSEEPAAQAATDEKVDTDNDDAASDSGGGASQSDDEGGAPADEASGGAEAPAASEEEKPE